MATNYQIKAEFSVIDKASPAISAIARKGQAIESAFAGPLAAAGERFSAFGAAAKKAATGAFGAVAAGAAYAVKQAVPLGMELEQNLGGTEAVFGDFANSVQKLAEQSYKNMGLSASDYMATANKMGSLFQGSGLEQARAMDLTTQAMQRAADVASVMGIDTSMAMESIAGAAKGNFTMMDNLGVAMNATTLQAYALEKGINFKWNTASNAEKAELAMQMFFERTTQYAGNFAHEADSTLSGSFGRMGTNIQDILANMALGRSIEIPLANMKESVLAFAHNIVPAVVNIINQLPDVIAGVVETVGPVIKQALGDIESPFGKILTLGLRLVQTIWDLKVPILAIAGAFALWHGIADVIFLIVKAMKAWEIVSRVIEGVQVAHQAAIWGTTVAVEAQGGALVASKIGMGLYAAATGVATGVTTGFTAATTALTAAIAANPIGLIIAGIVAGVAFLITIIVLVVKHFDSVVAVLKKVGAWFVELGGTIANFAAAAWEAIKNFFAVVYNAVMNFLFGENRAAVEQWVSETLASIAGFISSVFEKIGAFFASIGTAVAGFFASVWEKISGFFAMIGTAAAGFFSGIWEKITQFFSGIGTALAAWWSGIWAGITGFFASIGEAVGGWIDGIKGQLAPLFEWIKSLFDRIAEAWSGFVAVFKAEGIIGVFRRIAQGIFSLVLAPIQGLLNTLSKIPGLGGLGDLANNIGSFRGGLMDAATSPAESPVRSMAPVQTTSAVTNTNETTSTSNLNISLDNGLKASAYGSVAPGVTVQRARSGGF